MNWNESVEEEQRLEHAMEPYDEFLQRVQDIHRLGALQGHLGWDQEVLMPAKGAASRGEMMAWLAGKRHEQLTDPRMGELLSQLEGEDLDEDQAANVREMRRTYDQAVRLPKSFVETFAQARSEALVACGRRPAPGAARAPPARVERRDGRADPGVGRGLRGGNPPGRATLHGAGLSPRRDPLALQRRTGHGPHRPPPKAHTVVPPDSDAPRSALCHFPNGPRLLRSGCRG